VRHVESNVGLWGRAQDFKRGPRLLSSYQTVAAPHFADRGRNVLGVRGPIGRLWLCNAKDDGACARVVMMPCTAELHGT
jgi:hypothetical protein